MRGTCITFVSLLPPPCYLYTHPASTGNAAVGYTYTHMLLSAMPQCFVPTHSKALLLLTHIYTNAPGILYTHTVPSSSLVFTATGCRSKTSHSLKRSSLVARSNARKSWTS